MTVIAVLADPPREGLGYPSLPATSPLSAAEATELYEAVLRDLVRAVDRSGGDLLVNHPTEEQLPADARTGTDPEAELRAVVADVLGDASDARFEPQVGSTFSARAGNTATHLLREEGAGSVAIVTPATPFLSRSIIDAAAMKLRTATAVLGPSTAGRCHYAGFTEPIDFAGAFEPPSVQTLAERTRDAGGEVEFVRSLPTIETGRDLLDVVPLLRARFAAERIVPEHTAAFVHEHGLAVHEDDADGELTLIRE
ncbi:hypothetical protein [Halopenitus persicus]|uniref:DUF2064 domain-containing protein n=1 Tax=Halopenitus persicus TaxID=1048396 RepID=A0A1H3E1C8_9EURY|nr:hypothetical protein [Halopenitus persicus]QHS16456.1 hypothetical protein GWK26_04410 [haloarchaeon 3A1-DGR]SDX72481.1 hypothetical protein SAMN05216564_101243 [Halopenitus persicus]